MDSVPPVTLVTGPEELLAERAVSEVVQLARAADPAVDVRRLAGSEVDAAQLLELTSPSLFGDTTVLVIDSAHELASEAAAGVAALIREPVEQVALVLVHSGAANRA